MLTAAPSPAFFWHSIMHTKPNPYHGPPRCTAVAAAEIATRLCRFAATRDDFGRTAFPTVTVRVRVVVFARRQKVVTFLFSGECARLVMCVPVHTSAPSATVPLWQTQTQAFQQQQQRCLHNIISQPPPSGKCYQLQCCAEGKITQCCSQQK